MSDKINAALAAEQADAEATTTQEAELLPAATLDELEQVDLGTVAEGERAPFRITDDRCADWAIRKIADEQIAAINEKVAAARKRMENGTSYLTSCLADFFATVPHKETKTTEKYRLLSGTLTFKKGTTKTKLDETKLVPWLKANGYGELVKVEESTRWADLKKLLSYTGDIATLTETGEIVEGVTVYETPGIFTVDV
jgi:urease accessory protein UreH